MLLVAAAHSQASGQRKAIIYYLFFLAVNFLVAATTTPTSIMPAAIVHLGLALILIGALLWQLEPVASVLGSAVKKSVKQHGE